MKGCDRTEVTFSGAVVGELWWEGTAAVSTHRTLTRSEIDGPTALVEMAAYVLDAESRDFRSLGQFTADSSIIVARFHRGAGGTITKRARLYDLVELPSMAPFVTESWYASDFPGLDS